MPQPPAPPAGAKKKRQRMILIGGGALLLLVFLYMRSKSASSPNATSAADAQSAIDRAVANQQQQDAAQYAAQGYGGGSTSGGYQSTDLTPVTSGLSTLDTDIQNLPGILAGTLASTSAAAAPPAQTSPSAQAPITINVGPAAQPVATTSTAGRPASAPRISTLTAGQRASGIVAAPFGATKPTAGIPRGYTVVGLGSGNWGYKPPARTRRGP